MLYHAILYTSIFYAVRYKRKLAGDFYSFPINFEISSSKSSRCYIDFQSSVRLIFNTQIYYPHRQRFFSWKIREFFFIPKTKYQTKLPQIEQRSGKNHVNIRTLMPEIEVQSQNS